MTYNVYLSIGSNIDPEENVRVTLRRLGEIVRIQSVSPVYLTRPVRVEPEAGNFHNLCVQITTDWSPGDLKERLRSLEEAVGRDRSKESSSDHLHPSRTVDVDILLYDPEPENFQPHPQVEKQAFVVYPLSDIFDPSRWDPLPDSVEEWRAHCDQSTIVRTVEYDELDQNE